MLHLEVSQQLQIWRLTSVMYTDTRCWAVRLWVQYLEITQNRTFNEPHYPEEYIDYLTSSCKADMDWYRLHLVQKSKESGRLALESWDVSIKLQVSWLFKETSKNLHKFKNHCPTWQTWQHFVHLKDHRKQTRLLASNPRSFLIAIQQRIQWSKEE